MMEKELSERELWPQTLLIASPRGFCAGVRRAIDALWDFHKQNQAKESSSTTYSYHQIIHNTHVVRDFENSGVVFVNDINEIPEGENVMFSAHGFSPEVRRQAEERKLSWIDATCPLVEKPHKEIRKFASDGYAILYIGHADHDETIGILGEAPEHIKLIENIDDAESVEVADPEKVAFTTQTTLSIDDTAEIRKTLKERFPNIIEPSRSDICYATQNRQDGVKEMIQRGASVIIVVGSPNSSNSKRLAEVAEASGIRAYFVDEVGELVGREDEFLGVSIIGLTSGASAPEDKFQEVVSWFYKRGSKEIVEIIVEDESKISFAPPKGL